jgi:hypothetical protein
VRAQSVFLLTSSLSLSDVTAIGLPVLPASRFADEHARAFPCGKA